MGRSSGMSRVVHGDKAFQYEYVPKEQPHNLLYLSAVSGAGTSFLVPELVGLLANEDASLSWNCLAIGRALLLDGKASRQGELGALLRKVDRDYLRADEASLSMAAIESAMAENIVPLLDRLDASVKAPLLDLMLVGTVGYELSRADWLKMFSFLNESLSRPRQLDWGAFETAALTDNSEVLLRIQTGLRGKVEYLPWMGFSILAHAVRNGMDRLVVRESEPEMLAEGFWEQVRQWHGFEEASASAGGGSQCFASGLVAHFAGREGDARRALMACKKAGDARAERYLAMLGRDGSLGKA